MHAKNGVQSGPKMVPGLEAKNVLGFGGKFGVQKAEDVVTASSCRIFIGSDALNQSVAQARGMARDPQFCSRRQKWGSSAKELDSGALHKTNAL